MFSHIMTGIVYLIQPSELVGTDRYKIGCSNSPTLKRCQTGYRNGTRYICIMECDEPMKVETELKKAFGDRFKLIAGTEFFQGDEFEMLNLFFQIVSENKRPQVNDPLEDIHRLFPVVPPSKSKYVEFVNHILIERPEWYVPNTWLPHSLLVEKFNERIGADEKSHIITRNMNNNGLLSKSRAIEKELVAVVKL